MPPLSSCGGELSTDAKSRIILGMTVGALDPPLTLSGAEKLFSEFLFQNGHPPRVRWLTAADLIVDKRGRFWVRGQGTNANPSREANRQYSVGLERNLGIALRALCSTDAETFATVLLPRNDADAQYNLMGRCLKMSCPTSTRAAFVVKHPIRWFLLKLRNKGRSRTLEF
jgi:hypothetical protein